jgi:hypothetical protein
MISCGDYKISARDFPFAAWWTCPIWAALRCMNNLYRSLIPRGWGAGADIVINREHEVEFLTPTKTLLCSGSPSRVSLAILSNLPPPELIRKFHLKRLTIHLACVSRWKKSLTLTCRVTSFHHFVTSFLSSSLNFNKKSFHWTENFSLTYSEESSCYPPQSTFTRQALQLQQLFHLVSEPGIKLPITSSSQL